FWFASTTLVRSWVCFMQNSNTVTDYFYLSVKLGIHRNDMNNSAFHLDGLFFSVIIVPSLWKCASIKSLISCFLTDSSFREKEA
ncbi:MAG: hypothetical protein L0Y62_05775, partial [Nitrospirae bacterium]|nr:hypothetical protein [Nitrospirota bacterium]